MSANDNTPRDLQDKAKVKRCPICGKPRNQRYDPFCSKRCADIDLHRWLKGTYVVPGAEPGKETDEDDEV